MVSYKIENGKLIRIVEEEIDQSAIVREVDSVIAKIKPYKDASDRMKREINQFNIEILQKQNEIKAKQAEVEKRNMQIANYDKTVADMVEGFANKIDKNIVKQIAPDKANFLGF